MSITRIGSPRSEWTIGGDDEHARAADLQAFDALVGGRDDEAEPAPRGDDDGLDALGQHEPRVIARPESAARGQRRERAQRSPANPYRADERDERDGDERGDGGGRRRRVFPHERGDTPGHEPRGERVEPAQPSRPRRRALDLPRYLPDRGTHHTLTVPPRAAAG